MSQDLPSPELLRKLLRYETKTGKLFWRERTPEMFRKVGYEKSWNARYANKEAFTSLNSEGYFTGQIYCKTYSAHRVILAMHTGTWSKQDVDHINGIKSDNRISNLRNSTHAQNMYNTGPYANNKSGQKGVYFHERDQRWRAQIRISGKVTYLGSFIEKSQAVAAYQASAIKHHGEFAPKAQRGDR
jgi:hypothetical protein